jgi:hypothetical protein
MDLLADAPPSTPGRVKSGFDAIRSNSFASAGPNEFMMWHATCPTLKEVDAKTQLLNGQAN